MVFEQQAQELRELLKRSHLTEEQMAIKAHLKAETLRKYLGGYQKCGERTMIALRTVAQMEIDRLKTAAQRAGGPADLHDDVIVYAGKLLSMPARKRELAKQFIDELHSSSEKDRASIQDKAAAAGERAVEHYRQAKKKASGSSERKAQPSSGAHRAINPSPPSEGQGHPKKNS